MILPRFWTFDHPFLGLVSILHSKKDRGRQNRRRATKRRKESRHNRTNKKNDDNDTKFFLTHKKSSTRAKGVEEEGKRNPKGDHFFQKNKEILARRRPWFIFITYNRLPKKKNLIIVRRGSRGHSKYMYDIYRSLGLRHRLRRLNIQRQLDHGSVSPVFFPAFGLPSSSTPSIFASPVCSC